MKDKKIKYYLLFVGLLFILVLYFSLREDYKDILQALGHVKIFYLLLGIIFVFISKYFIGLTTYFLSKKDKKNISLKKMIEIAFIYPFFAGITPSSVGGEAFEVFYLKESGLSYGKASNVSMQKFILYQISLIIVNFIAVILNLFTNIVPNTSLVGSTVTLNFIVNIVILGFCYLVTYNKKLKDFILYKGLAFLYKIKIIKNLEETRGKIDEYLENFDEGAKALREDRKLFIQMVVLNIFSLVFFIIAAWPIATSLGINHISGLNLFILATYAKMMCLLIVTPGNSGAAEYCFIYLFTGLILEDDIMAYMLIWRFVTYYIPLILGGVLALIWGKGKECKNEEVSSSKS